MVSTQEHKDQHDEKNEHKQTIKLTSEWYVKPKYLPESATKHPYYLGPLDLAMLSIDPIQKGLLFSSSNPQTQTPSLLHKLELSLSLALVHFYPLSGRLQTQKYPEEKSCWIYLDCAKGEGARLMHATATHVSVSDILSNDYNQNDVWSLFDLGQRSVNYDGHTLPLLSIQVTELIDGVFIGFTINHSIIDGTTFTHFMSSLSEIYKSIDQNNDENEVINISSLPLHKTTIPEGFGPVIKLPYLEPDEFVTRFDPGPLKEKIFHFSTKSMAALKAKANQDCKRENHGSGNHVTISSFQALSGLVWRSILRARNPARDQDTTCTMLINARPRLEPPLSNDYFGNYLSGAFLRYKVDELLGRSLGWAGLLLHKEIMGCTDEKIQGLWKMIANKPWVRRRGSDEDSMHFPYNVVIGGSARFDMYGPEFGLGRASAVRTGFANKEVGKVTANPGCEGGGSVDLEICLRPEEMVALEEDHEFMSFVSI